MRTDEGQSMHREWDASWTTGSLIRRIHLDLPAGNEDLNRLRIGDLLDLSGIVYTARDAAHRRLAESLEAGHELPLDLRGQAIYYVGPCPAPPGRVIGSAGPTTSGRMDPWTPLLLDHGLKVMIGKGRRDTAVIAAIRRAGAVYLGVTGGAGALLAQRITDSELVAYADLGTEAIRRLRLLHFPAIVLIDSTGADLYDTGPLEYLAGAKG